MQTVRDNYAIYFFNEQVTNSIQESLATENKSYITSFNVSLEAPNTEKYWSPENDLSVYLSESGASARLSFDFIDGKSDGEYTTLILELLASIYKLEANSTVLIRANNENIFWGDFTVFGDSVSSPYTYESVMKNIEVSRLGTIRD